MRSPSRWGGTRYIPSTPANNQTSALTLPFPGFLRKQEIVTLRLDISHERAPGKLKILLAASGLRRAAASAAPREASFVPAQAGRGGLRQSARIFETMKTTLELSAVGVSFRADHPSQNSGASEWEYCFLLQDESSPRSGDLIQMTAARWVRGQLQDSI